MAHPLALRSARAMLIPVLLMVGGACKDWAKPVAPSQDTRPVTTAATQSGPSVFKDGVHILDPAQIEILSGPEERRDGIWRLRSRTGEALQIGAGDFLVAWTPEQGIVLREVTAAATPLAEIELRTVEAFWPQILNGGTYRVSIPLAPAPVAGGGDKANIPLNPAGTVIPIDIDFCKPRWWQLFPAFMHNTDICNLGQHASVSYGWLSLGGNIDSLKVTGSLTWGGEIDVDITIDPGRYDPGVLPVFSPCNNKPGACLFTGVCVPGTQVLTQLWPPVYEICKIEIPGRPPSLIPPSIGPAGATINPSITGQLTVVGAGNGSLTIDIPLWGLPDEFTAITLGQRKIGEVEVKLSITLTFKADGTTKATARVDQEVALAVGFTPPGHIGTQVEQRKNEAGFQLDFSGSVGVEVAFTATAGATFKPLLFFLPKSWPDSLLGSFKVGAAARLPYVDAVYTTPTLDGTWDPDRPPMVSSWHVDVDMGADFSPSLTLDFPKAFANTPTVGVSWTPPPQEMFRFGLFDIWGRGDAIVNVLVDGDASDIDPDGYELTARRVDPDALPVDTSTHRVRIPAGGTTLSLLQNLAARPDSLCKRGLNGSVQPQPIYTDCEFAVQWHELSLGDLEPNCHVVGGRGEASSRPGPNPRVVLPRPIPDTVSFFVLCHPLGDASRASLRIGTKTAGPGATTYSVLIDGREVTRVPANGFTVVTGVMPGTLSVELRGLGGFCSSATPNPVRIDVAPGEAAAIDFDVDCTARPSAYGALRIVTATSGVALDPDGYAVQVDGARVGTLPVSGMTVLSPVGAGRRIVGLENVARNCLVVGENPRSLAIATGDTVDVEFEVVCADEPSTGHLSVVVHTLGDLAPRGYRIRAGNIHVPVGARDTVVVTGLPEGALQVRLLDVPTGCSMLDANPQQHAIIRDATVGATFRVFCAPGGVGSTSTAGTANIAGVVATPSAGSMSALPSMIACWTNADRPENRGRILEGYLARMFQMCFPPQTVAEHHLQMAFEGGIEGSATMTRAMALDAMGGGGVTGQVVIEGQWNGSQGVFRGLLAGTVSRRVISDTVPRYEDMIVKNMVLSGEGGFQGLILNLEMRGGGPFSWTGTVRPATSR